MAYTNRETALKKAFGSGFASPNFDNFRDDKEIVLLGLRRIRSDGGCLQYVSERLRDDEDVVLLAIEEDPEGLREASYRWRDDKEMVVKAISHHWWSLAWASDRLKADKELVLMALKGGQKNHKNDTFHRFVNRERMKELIDVSLMVDPDVVKEAVSLNYQFMTFAPYSLKGDPNFILPFIKELDSDRRKGELIACCADNIKSLFDTVERIDWNSYIYVGENSEYVLEWYIKTLLAEKLEATLTSKSQSAPKKLKI